MKTRLLITISLAIAVYGCAHNETTRLTDAKATGPKVIALDAPRLPWTVEFESRLRKAGFKVLRTPARKEVEVRTSESRLERFKSAETRFVLVLDGEAFLDPMRRCFGGGYKFNYLTAELVDTSTNETVFSHSASGYSENCPPLSGTIFSDVVTAVDSVWAR